MAVLETHEQHQELIDELIADVSAYNPDVDRDLIARAFRFAADAHEGQQRLSGEHFVLHPWGAANICAQLPLDDETIAAALLDDVADDKYEEIKAMVTERRADREGHVSEAARILQLELDKVDIPVEISGRAKHFYSIYDKMAKKGREFNEIYDLTAMRVIVERSGDEGTRDCYGALGLIHSLWKPMPGRFKDYVAMPKFNRYRSLHTTVIGPEGRPLEIQVRTREMHREAELGIAAHWLYKKGKSSEAMDVEWLDWVHQLMDAEADDADPREFMKTFRTDLFDDEVYVFTPQGEVKTLPTGATPIDFAYAVHTDGGQ